MLTAVKISNAKPRLKPYKLADSEGLFIQVRPNGSKLWRWKYRIAGAERLLALGAFPEVGLAEARRARMVAKKLLTQGYDPVKERSDRKRALIEAELDAKENTFGEVTARWIDKIAKIVKPSTLNQHKREIRKDLLPLLKDRPMRDISRVEVARLLTRVEKCAPEVTRNLRKYLWLIFEYAIDSGIVTSSPVPSTRLLMRRTLKNQPSVPAERFGELLVALDDRTRMEEKTRIAMLLVILTACRKCEVIGGRWCELDLDTKTWIILAERMKTKEEHFVPLSSQALALIRELRDIVPDGSEYMFPNRRDASCPMAGRTLNSLLENLGFSRVATPHGMRARFSTDFNGMKANPAVVECCLSHKPKDKVRGAYNRNKYEAERRVLLQEWADLIDEIRDKEIKKRIGS